MPRLIVAALAATLCSFALAAPAGAATVTFDGGGLHVIGDDMVDNIRLAFSGDVAAGTAKFTVDRQPGGAFGFGSSTPLTAGGGCTQPATGKVECSNVNVALAEIRLAGGDDQVTWVAGPRFDSSIFLGDGDDEVTFGFNTDAPPEGFDLIRGEAGNDRIDGAGGNDRIEGGPGEDRLLGGGGSDDIRGDAGDDVLLGDATTLVEAQSQVEGPLMPDSLDGGDGTDTADYSEFSRDTRIRLDSSGGRVVTPGQTATEGDTYTAVENVAGSKGTDDVVGTDAPNHIDGAGGDDVIDGQGGADILIGGLGGDDITGRAGDDQLFGGVQTPLSRTRTPDPTEGDGGDTLAGGAGDDEVYGDLGADTLSGDTGADMLFTRDGTADKLACGTEPGAAKTAVFSTAKLRVVDYAQVDARDANPGDCEAFDSAGADDDPAVAIRTGRLTVGARGVVTVRLSCPSETTRGCKGRLDARLSRGAKTTAPGGKRGTSYSLKRGQAKRVTAKLPTKDLKLLARRPGTAATLQLTSAERGPKTVVRLTQVRYRG